MQTPSSSASSRGVGCRPRVAASASSAAPRWRALSAHGPAGPVVAAEFVDDAAANSHAGVARERHAAIGVEAAGGLRQRHHAGGGEVVTADMSGQPARGFGDQVPHERKVLPDEIIVGSAVRSLDANGWN